MSDTIIVGLLTLLGTLTGTFGGIITASKLTTYRIERLEEKVDKHNGMIERMYTAEGAITELRHDVRDLKNYHRPN
ncbi:MAG: hypothetical protein E7316_04625 [Clostridiales bacterium]|nr:hypothetical protein [Clostridiales bacterium]